MSSYLRKIERNILKEEQGNNNIKRKWREHQIDKYSIQDYCDLYNKNNKKMNKLKPNEIYNI